MNLPFKLFLSMFFLLEIGKIQAQNSFDVDISNSNFPIISNHLKLGTHINAKGESLDANSLYFMKNGKPWFPVMGECHFSRLPREQWESSILKMKACGINIIATYVFWIYHEEEKGIWDFSGNRDLGYFAALCAKHHMDLFVRIGPWCHGEVRNGGFPDWLLKEAKTRSSDSVYLGYVNKFYEQIGSQLKGMYFKDGGPVIGVQIENEFRFNNPKGLSHILALKQMALDAGMDVPYYTATGWPGSNIRQPELIPVWGGYPEAPWDKRTTTLPLSANYLFDSLRSDPNIGNDLLGTNIDSTNYSGYRYPYATAEMGAGIQVTHHRRPIISPEDLLGMAITKTGAGANLMGYYMFHGGVNSIGKLSTLQESRATKYPNDYPILNYDFQAPIGQWGDIKPSYHFYKLFHSFLNHFGERLATCFTYFPGEKVSDKADSSNLRWAVRAKDGRGFIFINQYQRQGNMQDVNNVQFNIRLADGKSLKLPETPIKIPANTQFILPFNLDVDGVNVLYSTAQPFYIDREKSSTYFFYADDQIKAEYVLDTTNIASIHVKNAVLEKRSSTYKISSIFPGLDAAIVIKLSNGGVLRIVTLSHTLALQSWSFNIKGKTKFMISDAELTSDGKNLQVQSTGNTNVHLMVLGKNLNLQFSVVSKTRAKSKSDLFSHFELHFKKKEIPVSFNMNDSLTELSSKMTDATRIGNLSDPLYGTALKPVFGSTFWDLKLGKGPQLKTTDAFLNVDYQGDTYATYINGVLASDDFYTGLPVSTALRQVTNVANSKITMMVTSFPKQDEIFFEKKIMDKMGVYPAPKLRRITVQQQYKSVVSGF